MIAQVDLIVICGISLTQKERLAKATSADKSGTVSSTRISRSRLICETFFYSPMLINRQSRERLAQVKLQGYLDSVNRNAT